MPEISKDATLLLAISWQAQNRINNKDTEICNSSIVLVFATFYIEANLNHIIETIGEKQALIDFCNNYKFPGLLHKLWWFQNHFIDNNSAKNKDQINKQRMKCKIRRTFPGFFKLYNFRNNLSHGIIDQKTANSKQKD